LSNVEILSRIERRRKWTVEEKAALLAEVEAEGGKVKLVARRHRISESLLYNWRSAWKAAAAARAPEAVTFMPLGVFRGTGDNRPAMLAPPEPDQSRQPSGGGGGTGAIEIALPNGTRVCVDALVNEKALSRVLRAMKGAT
jgi:transposase